MNIVTGIRSRLNVVVGAAIGAFFFITCGAVLAFVISPQQALRARRIEHLPHMTAEDVAVAAPGDDILVTGRLEDNPVIARDRFVAYTREVWQVTVPTPGDQSSGQSNDATGKWETVERIVPDLVLNVNDRRIDVLQGSSVRLSGPLHERLVRGYSSRKASYKGEMLAQGSERVRGFHNGDLTTVLGARASAGGVIPEELFAGDRVAFSQYKKDAARGMFIFGLCMMGLAPVVLGGGVLSALLGRWRR